jgi:hypothetical protein
LRLYVRFVLYKIASVALYSPAAAFANLNASS